MATNDKYLHKIYELLGDEIRMFKSDRKIFIILGLLGDFDSLEYVQHIINDKAFFQSFDIIALAIGTEEAKEKFCTYTGFPSRNLYVYTDNKIHKELNLYSGLRFQVNDLVNMLLMCCGIGSSGTLKEVLRGYCGDKESSAIFAHDNNYINDFMGKSFTILFRLFDRNNRLLPFELATLRLLNLLEVIQHWKLYMINNRYLTQRGATIVCNSKNELIYSYFSHNLLGYSDNMRDPLLTLKSI